MMEHIMSLIDKYTEQYGNRPELIKIHPLLLEDLNLSEGDLLDGIPVYSDFQCPPTSLYLQKGYCKQHYKLICQKNLDGFTNVSQPLNHSCKNARRAATN
jgi:hypothetical protein